MTDIKWDDYVDAKPIDEAERDRWVQEIVKQMRGDGQLLRGTYTTSGDSIVFAFEHPEGDVYLIDAKIRRETSVYPEDVTAPAGRDSGDAE